MISIEIFYAIPHLYIPVLPPKDEFYADLAQHTPLLLNSILALASTYATFPVSQDYRALALARLESFDTETMESFSAESVQYMQSILILVCLEFGKANIPLACELIGRACTFAQNKGWNMLDVVEGDNIGSEFTVNRDGPLIRRGHTGANSINDDLISRRVRIVWWECWACDIVMSVTCRQQRNFHGVTVNVSLPSAPPLYREPGSPIVWVSLISRSFSV